MSRPLIVYDAECAFGGRWIRRWRARTGDRVESRPFQERGLLARYGIPVTDARRAIQLVRPRQRRRQGAEAVFLALEQAPELRAAARVGRWPVVRAIAAWIYRRIGRHRGLAARGDRWLFGRSTRPPTHALVRSVFLRALGGVYAIAFTSLRAQALGLYGEHGILPAREHLDAIRRIAPARVRRMPTYFPPVRRRTEV